MANITGLDSLLRRLNRIAGNDAVNKGIEKGTLRVEATAKENSTVDTGMMRASIDHRLDSGSLSGTVFAGVNYAKFVEFGTSKQSAQPYLYPALASNVDKIKQDILQAIRNEIGGV